MRFRPTVEATLSGIAQVIFCDRPLAGLLVLASAAVLAPWAAAGAAAGALIATVSHRRHDAEEWQLGLYGFNAAIVGMLWGGPLARHDATATLLPLAIFGCIALEAALRPHVKRLGFPILGAPTLAIGWTSDWAFRVFGDSIWVHPGTLPLGEGSVPLAVLCLGAAVAIVSVPAALVTGLIAAVAAFGSAWWYGIDGLGPASFWAFAVAPAALGGYRIVPLMRAHAIAASLLAATVAAGVWLVWVSTPAVAALPPLIAPCIFGVWVVLGAIVHRGGLLTLDPGLWRLASLLRMAGRDGKPAAVLSGAGVSTASGIPDYVSGAWLDPTVPPQTYAFGSFVASPACRRAYWSACARFRAAATQARPNAAHSAIATLQRAGWVSSIITQNVDGLHQAAGATDVIEIHGSIDRCRCLACGWTGDWPPHAPWRADDVHCPRCAGMLKPAVIAMGEDLPAQAMAAAEAAVRACGLLIVVGTQLAISSASALVAVARRHGAIVAFINTGPIAQPVTREDLFLSHRCEPVLASLAFVLGCGPAPARRGIGLDLAWPADGLVAARALESAAARKAR